MRFLAALSVAFALVAAGCRHDGEDSAQTVTVRETVTETQTGTGAPPESPRTVTLYFLRDGEVAPVARGIGAGANVATMALHELLQEPEAGFSTAIPPGRGLVSLAIERGVARVALDAGISDRRALAQIVYTLTQFPTVQRVAVNGAAPVGRAAFEDQTPAILVESPLPGETVEPGFEATGTANTFEANFQFELADETGRVISEDFVTATSGSGTRGTFRFEVPYEVDRPQRGALTVFEISAASGARTNELRIPLRLE